MTGQTTASPGARRTRRQMIAAGTGALAAVLAGEAVARPAPAQAADGNPLLLGEENHATGITEIISDSGHDALILSTGPSVAIIGGAAGLRAVADHGDGVSATSGSGIGVRASGGSGEGGVGVLGQGRVGVSGDGGVQGVAGVSKRINTLFGTTPAGEGVYGQSGNTASTETILTIGVHGITDDAAGSGVLGENAAGGVGVAGAGTSGGDGVSGTSDTGRGVVGVVASGKGVFGQRGDTGPAPTLVNQHGVHGVTDASLGHAVYGEHVGFGTAVAGLSKLGGTAVAGTASGGGAGGSFGTDSGTGAQGSSGTGKGVWGISGNAGTFFLRSANGVHGLTGSTPDSAVLGEHAAGGPGVTGLTTGTAAAVHGKNSGPGAGMLGESPAGTGVSAVGKTALDVTGPAVFSRSGKLTIKAGSTSATKTGLALTAASLVLVTPQNDVSGTAVRSAVPNVKAGSFTVHLARAVTHQVTIAWFIVN